MAQITKDLSTGQNSNRVLHEVSFTIGHGESVAILGRSGSGKSTLLSLLALFDRPTTGTYLCEGVDTATLSDRGASAFRSATFGFMFQRFFLLKHLTAWENVAVSLLNGQPTSREASAKKMATNALEMVGIGHLARRKPAALSGGEQQRVALARALVRNPTYLFADEPTGALDVDTGQQIMDLLASLPAQGTTVVMVTHDHEYASKMERILRIDNGRLGEVTRPGPPAEAPLVAVGIS